MKRAMIIGAAILVGTAAVLLCTAAGVTVKQSPISLGSLTVQNTTVEVYFAKGVTTPTNIRVGVVGPGQGHIQVKVKKQQGMSVGSLTNFSEAAWVNVTSGDFYNFVFNSPITIRTTNALENVVCIYVD